MDDTYVKIPGLDSILMALVAAQAPAPTDEWLRSQIPAFEPAPAPLDMGAWRALRELRELGSCTDWNIIRRDRPELADETEAYERRFRSWQDRSTEHARVHCEAARFLWRVGWAGKVLAAVHDWERKAQP